MSVSLLVKRGKKTLKPISIAAMMILAVLYAYSTSGGLRSKAVKNFFSEMVLGRDEQLERILGDYYRWMHFVRMVTPENSLLIFPRPENFSDNTKIRHPKLAEYFVFPRHCVNADDKTILSHQGPIYRVRVKGFDFGGEYLKEDRFDSNFSLLLIKQKDKRNSEGVDFSTMKVTPLMRILALLKFFLIVLSGVCVVGNCFSEKSGLSFFTTSFLVGSILDTVSYILLSLLGARFTEGFQWGLLSALALPGVLLLMRQSKTGGWIPPTRSHCRQGILIVCLVFGGLFLKNFRTPLVGWDGWGIWCMKAKALFAFNDLRELKFWGARAALHYPPLLPVAMSQLAIGGEGIINLLFPFFALCLYANVYEEVWDTKYPPFLATVLPLLIFSSPVFWRHSSFAYSNLLLAVFITKAVTLLPKVLKENTSKRWLSLAIILCGAILVRPDGIAYFFCIVIVAMVWQAVHRCPLQHHPWYLWIPAGVFLLWDLYCYFILEVPPIGALALRGVLRRLWIG